MKNWITQLSLTVILAAIFANSLFAQFGDSPQPSPSSSGFVYGHVAIPIDAFPELLDGEQVDLTLFDSYGNSLSVSGVVTESSFVISSAIDIGSDAYIAEVRAPDEILHLMTLVVVVPTDPQEPEEPAHRGRIQIQGSDMTEEISWAWSQDTPPTKADGLRELDRLYNSLTDKQKNARKEAYEKARKWIRNCPVAGVDAQVSKTWGNKDDASKRIDIEVIKGKAFTGEDPEAEDDLPIPEVPQS